jgi:hypothetical protein
LAEIAPGNFRGTLLRRTPAKSAVFAGCAIAGACGASAAISAEHYFVARRQKARFLPAAPLQAPAALQRQFPRNITSSHAGKKRGFCRLRHCRRLRRFSGNFRGQHFVAHPCAGHAGLGHGTSGLLFNPPVTVCAP